MHQVTRKRRSPSAGRPQRMKIIRETTVKPQMKKHTAVRRTEAMRIRARRFSFLTPTSHCHTCSPTGDSERDWVKCGVCAGVRGRVFADFSRYVSLTAGIFKVLLSSRMFHIRFVTPNEKVSFSFDLWQTTKCEVFSYRRTQKHTAKNTWRPNRGGERQQTSRKDLNKFNTNWTSIIDIRDMKKKQKPESREDLEETDVKQQESEPAAACAQTCKSGAAVQPLKRGQKVRKHP